MYTAQASGTAARGRRICGSRRRRGSQRRVGPPRGPSPGQGLGNLTPAESASGGEATPPITGGWDHGGSGWSGAPYGFPPGIIKRSSCERSRPDPSYPPSQRCGMVVKASIKPWPRRLGSSIMRALPPQSKSSPGVPPVSNSRGPPGRAWASPRTRAPPRHAPRPPQNGLPRGRTHDCGPRG